MIRWSSREGGELLLFDEAAVRERLDAATCVAAVEEAFRQLGSGTVAAPGVLSVHSGEGAFHIKAAAAGGYFVAKVNANYPGNPSVGLPTIQGLLVLFEMGNGRPLAVMDSAELTARRTGAATGVAVKYLSVDGPVVVTLCGCGRQALAQLESVAAVRPIGQAYLYDVDPSVAEQLANAVRDSIAAEAISGTDLFARTRESDVVITCTPSRSAFLTREAVRPGCLVAAVGADNPHKHEIAPELMASSRVVVDVLEQCAVMGDLHHALEEGVMGRDQVYAELGEVVAGSKPGRVDRNDIIVFDSTGMALQDVAAAVVVYHTP